MKLYPVFDRGVLVGTFSSLDKAEEFISENEIEYEYQLFVGIEHSLDAMVGFRLRVGDVQ